jgi:hypothetical protein
VTLDQAALSDLLDAIRAGGNIAVIRKGMELVLQALIEAEVADEIGADRYERGEPTRPGATATGTAWSPPTLGTLSSRRQATPGELLPLGPRVAPTGTV